MSSFEQLVKVVLEKSESKKWQDAIEEWDLYDTDEDEDASSVCVCGKTGIRYLHKIKNNVNNKIIYPIGSCCIEKFKRADLNEKISVKEKLFKLYHAVGQNKFLNLDTELFSRKLIKYLYREGAFDSDNPNYHSENSYSFFLDMFNKRNKEDITENQKRKISAIIMNNIIPFVRKQLAGKFVKKSKQ